MSDQDSEEGRDQARDRPASADAGAGPPSSPVAPELGFAAATVGGGARFAPRVVLEQRSSWRRYRDGIIRVLLFAAATVSLLTTVGIVVSLVGEAWTFISQVELSALWGDQWAPRFGRYDLKTLIVGSLIVTGIAMVVAAPIGLGGAVFLSEYASAGVRRWLKPILEILAGIPSVVFGFFALQWISPELVQRFFSEASVFNLMAAGIGVGFLTIPLVAAVSEDALRVVPRELREASAALGARKVTTTIRIVIPAAVSGLVAALILAISRAIGETMVVFLAAGGAGNVTQFTVNPLDPGSTMTAAMASQATGTDAVVGEALTFQSLFFVGLVLFVITLGLNVLSARFVRAASRHYQR